MYRVVPATLSSTADRAKLRRSESPRVSLLVGRSERQKMTETVFGRRRLALSALFCLLTSFSPQLVDAAAKPRCTADERLCPIEYGSTRFIVSSSCPPRSLRAQRGLLARSVWIETACSIAVDARRMDQDRTASCWTPLPWAAREMVNAWLASAFRAHHSRKLYCIADDDAQLGERRLRPTGIRRRARMRNSRTTSFLTSTETTRPGSSRQSAYLRTSAHRSTNSKFTLLLWSADK